MQLISHGACGSLTCARSLGSRVAGEFLELERKFRKKSKAISHSFSLYQEIHLHIHSFNKFTECPLGMILSTKKTAIMTTKSLHS